MNPTDSGDALIFFRNATTHLSLMTDVRRTVLRSALRRAAPYESIFFLEQLVSLKHEIPLKMCIMPVFIRY